MGGGVDTRYRADIDGLRAVAVGVVILYHLNPRLFPSGFVGVDLFFLISGYVVATSALGRLSDRWFADVLAFWMRRIRRIMPLLILVVVVGALAGAVLFPPFPLVNYQNNFRTAAAALVGASNLYLYRTASDYFLQSAAQQNPLLHTWSLGVEEQYYIYFALMLIAAPAILRLKASVKPYRVGITLLVMAATLGLALSPAISQLTKFYVPMTRIWEIAVGTLLALLNLGYLGGASRVSAKARLAFRLAAAAVVAGTAFVPHQGDAYPSAVVLLALAAGCILMAAPPAIDGRWEPLMSAPMVYLGRISYGLYLWHWIVFFCLDLTIGKDDLVGVVLAMILPLVLSVASFRLLEQPLRDRRRTRDITAFAIVAVGFVLAAGLLAVLDRKPGLLFAGAPQTWTKDWMPDEPTPYLADGRITKAACNLTGSATDAPMVPCRSVVPPGQIQTRILSLGDSHAFSDWSMLAYAHDHGFAWSARSKNGCSIPGSGIKTDAACNAYWDGADALIRGEVRAGDVLYISTNWHSYDDPTETRAKLDHVAALAQTLGVMVVVKAALPVFDKASYLCIREWYRTNYLGCTADRASELRRVAPVTRYLADLASRHGNVRVFDPFDSLCPDKSCQSLRDGRPLFRDATHLAAYGSSTLGPSFVQTLSGLPKTP